MAQPNIADSTPPTNDDFGSWDCNLCTYRNSAERFKCEICDFRRGTSTRKPRCNVDTIVAQVVKQQEQIRQQTRAKPSRNRQSNTNSNLAASSSSDTIPRANKNITINKSKASSSTSEHKRSIYHKARNDRSEVDYSGDEDDGEDDGEKSVSESSLDSSITFCSSTSNTSLYSSSSSLPEPTTSSPLSSSKPLDDSIIPLEVVGNLIKYYPPTSSGRTGLIIDKKRFTQHSVTVNDVTITFTEFATRQNNYVRKKKKNRRDTNRSKGNNTTTTTTTTTTTNNNNNNSGENRPATAN